MAEMKMKQFDAKWKAQKFIEENGTGYYEGPFIDENMNTNYLVFWNEQKDTNTVWDIEFEDGCTQIVRVSGEDVTLERCIEILKYRCQDINKIVCMKAREEKVL